MKRDDSCASVENYFNFIVTWDERKKEMEISDRIPHHHWHNFDSQNHARLLILAIS